MANVSFLRTLPQSRNTAINIISQMQILAFCMVVTISFAATAKSCAQSCSIQPTQEQIDSCTQNCTRDSIIAGAVIGGFFGTVILIVSSAFVYSYCRDKYCNGQDRVLDRTVQQINQVVYDNRSEQEFEYERQLFLSTDWYFYYYYTGSDKRHEKRYHFQTNRQSKMFYRLVGEATDDQGNWKLQGYYMNTAEGIKLTMKNQRLNYDDPESYVIYEGFMDDNKNYTGNWYIEGMEKYPGSKGRWKMEPRIRPITVETQLVYRN